MGHRGPHGPRLHFDKLDQDSDGRISKAEAATAPKFAERFDTMDANKDGFVDRADREAAMKQHRDAWFRSADANNDGSLSKAEFEAAHASRMAAAGARGRDAGRKAAPVPAPTK